MGEHKAKITSPNLLIVRLEDQKRGAMVAEIKMDQAFLERIWKLMLICQKIRQTMGGKARVSIELSCFFVLLYGPRPIQFLLTRARLKEWRQFQSAWIPGDIPLGELGQCRVEAGLQGSELVVEQDAFWIEGHGATHNLKSLNLSRQWVKQQLSRVQVKIPEC